MTSDLPDLTRNQSLVFDVLHKTGTPLSAYTILDKLRDKGLRAPLQVYRALDKLLDFGLVHRLESMNAFIACSNEHHTHTGLTTFAICDQCGTVAEFTEKEVTKHLDAWADDNDFEITKTTIELRGICSSCTTH